jgi:hypothetical protein
MLRENLNEIKYLGMELKKKQINQENNFKK